MLFLVMSTEYSKTVHIFGFFTLWITLWIMWKTPCGTGHFSPWTGKSFLKRGVYKRVNNESWDPVDGIIMLWCPIRPSKKIGFWRAEFLRVAP